MGRFSPESSDPTKISFLSNCPAKLAARYRKCRPSGRKTGQRWLDSKRAGSGLVISTGVPPADEVRNIPAKKFGTNRMVPSRFQVPPRPCGASHNTCADPPGVAPPEADPVEERSIFLSFPCAKNAMAWPSGDQNGCDASSVPGIGVAPRPPTGGVQSTYLLVWSQ